MSSAMVVILLLQLLCQLIGSNSGSSESISGAPVNQSSLPNGYIPYLDVGVALKVHNERVSWIEAMHLCYLEGANLAVIDSYAKFEHASRQRESTGFTHVGIHAMYDDEAWVSVVNASRVFSIPWAPGEPAGGWYCVMISKEKGGLGNERCTTLGDYICELPIPENYTVKGETVMEEILSN